MAEHLSLKLCFNPKSIILKKSSNLDLSKLLLSYFYHFIPIGFMLKLSFEVFSFQENFSSLHF